MNYLAVSNKFPKLKIKSDNDFFCKQINRIIVEQELLVDVIDDRSEEDKNKTIDIEILDHIPSNKEKLAPYMFLIVNPSEIHETEEIKQKGNVYVYKLGELRESVIAEDIKNVANKIIANSRLNSGLKSTAKELELEREKTSDYKTALEKSGAAQKYIMQPLFKDDTFDIKVIYEPYRHVSGDVLFVKKMYSKIFIMIADVTDHGCLAGMYGASLYALANNYVQNSSIIEQSVDMWGQYMTKAAKMYRPYGLTASDSMMINFTANILLCILDLEEQKASFCFYGSGQEPPILIRENGTAKALKVEDGIGAPIGDIDSSAKVYRKNFYPGNGIIFYTDGATEIFADAAEEKDSAKIYSSEKIVESVNIALKNNKNSSEEIIDYILKDASAYSITRNLQSKGNMPNITDDLTIMCIRWKGEYFD